MQEIPLVDISDLRQTLGAYVTGVTVVTTIDDSGRFHGLTANSFNSVSLDPPLVLWSQATKAKSHHVFYAADRFAVNILAEDQSDISNRFASSSHEKFEKLPVDVGLGGVPLLRGCSARLQCRIASRIAGGDHTIYVGQVCSVERSERRPLAFGNGRYLRVAGYAGEKISLPASSGA